MAKSKKPKADEAGAAPVSTPVSTIAHDTKDWIKTAADELAALAGMVFDGERGLYVCEWMEGNCYLYEGIGAGQPIKLIPYQREYVMRLYSWVYWSSDWKAYIRRFRWANLICAKKNGKSPFLAANGLFLTCADGEPGQKVYTIALNGKQAARTQEHAIAMAEQSPTLRPPVCVINKSTSTITHVETRSKMLILAGDDTRGAKANEGINGSVMIDELHVADRELHERVKGAGISRKEPINLAVSTAGDDPSSYGFERVEYGRRVNAGKQKDPHFLHVEYAAPQKATDEDISANAEKYAKAANPALGYTVNLVELVQDWETSRPRPREKNRCKQYRFDMWIGSTAPWLNEANWEACRLPLTAEDEGFLFRERECTLGIDLSRTRDMTAGVFNIPMPEAGDEHLALIPLFWLPRKTAEARKNLFDYMDWAECGDLTLTEGAVVDYDAAADDLVNFVESNFLVVTDIYFDQHYAEEFTQRLSDRLNCNRTAVTQTINTLSPLCKELERRIDAGRVHHNGNKVMTWQVGHVEVITDRNQNCRYVKPSPDSGKSVDGIAAAVNTFAGLVEQEDRGGGPGVTFL